MRQIITEGKAGKRSIYYLNELDEAGLSISKQAFDSRIEVSVNNGSSTIFIEDKDGHIRQKPFEYLNDIRRGKPLTSRLLMANAIQLMYNYCDIKHLNPESMSMAQVSDMINFMLGLGVEAEPGCSVTFRSPKTVNAYLGSIRTYLSEMGMDKSGFVLAQPISTISVIERDRLSRVPRIKTAVTVKTDPKRNREVPKHIRPHEMKEMVKLMRDAGDIQSLLICNLQYGYGLRSGEVLGITREDLVIEKYHNETCYYVILRNRVSDHTFQYCKNLLHPLSIDEYTMGFYKDSYWKIDIGEKLYNELIQYYTDSRDTRKIAGSFHCKNRDKLAEDKLSAILSNTRADSTEGGLNYYLFVGDNGKVLSGQTWNNHLTKYYLAVGIEPDKGCRYANCSHRLRHGFAMWHAQYRKEPLSLLELMKLMRHASPDSTAVYYTPLPEDQVKLHEEYAAEMRELIPEF